MMFHCIEAVSVFEGGGCQMPGDTDKVTNDAEVRIIIRPSGELQTCEYSINNEPRNECILCFDALKSSCESTKNVN